jgi:very-short-patch-repair endonuclease
MLNGPGSTIRNARALRRTMSLPEVLLWRELRTRPDGLKFRRQHPAGPYVLDFYCVGARLAIEIDGEAHDRGDRPARDEARDAWLKAERVIVLRIPAAEVLKDVGAITTMIVDAARQPLHRSSSGPPPRTGEDF